jgi:(S)-2-hydroxyglutarate dehydrogenase
MPTNRRGSLQMIDAPFDVIVVGAGIIGLSTALEFSRRFPQLSLGVLEKEKDIAAHQSGRNSGVIHSGISYKPGSLKAQMCVEGALAMVHFCEQTDIPFEVCVER